MLGVPVAHIYVTEYQTHGLPPPHLRIIRVDGSKLREHADIDSLISAKIPAPVKYLELYEVVKAFMIYGSCATNLNKNSLHMFGEARTKGSLNCSMLEQLWL